MSVYAVKIGDFEGPLEVLLRLVEEKKMHINQVSLALVADSFIGHMKTLPEDNRAQLANFILVASTLMLIKSLSLLPKLTVSEEEEGSMADLERRLKLYQEVKRLSEYVRQAYGQKIIFARQESKNITPIFSPSQDLTLANITRAINRIIDNLPKVEKLAQVVIQKVISLEEAITDLTNRVQTALKTSFRDFVRGKKDKVNIIVSFLGMLELVKQGIVSVEQGDHFQDIAIETAATGVPKYG